MRAYKPGRVVAAVLLALLGAGCSDWQREVNNGTPAVLAERRAAAAERQAHLEEVARIQAAARVRAAEAEAAAAIEVARRKAYGRQKLVEAVLIGSGVVLLTVVLFGAGFFIIEELWPWLQREQAAKREHQADMARTMAQAMGSMSPEERRAVVVQLHLAAGGRLPELPERIIDV